MNKKQTDFIKKFHEANSDKVKHQEYIYSYSEHRPVHLNLEGLTNFADAILGVDATPDDLYCIKRRNGSVVNNSDLTFDQATNYLHGMMLNVIDQKLDAVIINYNRSKDLKYKYLGQMYSYTLQNRKAKTQDDFFDQWPP